MFAEEADGEEEATKVESAPWVMTTNLGLEAFDLVKPASLLAIVSSESSYNQSLVKNQHPRHVQQR